MNKHAESNLFSTCNETLDQKLGEYNYLGQVPNQEKEIRRRIGMGWGALGKHSKMMKSKLLLPLKTIQQMYPASDDVRIRKQAIGSGNLLDQETSSGRIYHSLNKEKEMVFGWPCSEAK